MKLTQAEEWRDLVDPYWGQFFQVSNTGKCRSKDRFRDGKFFRGKEKKLRTNGVEPHLVTNLKHSEDGKMRQASAYITKEIALAFIPKPKPLVVYKQMHRSRKKKKVLKPYLYAINIDGDYENNYVSNIRWATGFEIYQKKLKNGMRPLGGSAPSNILSRAIQGFVKK